MKTTVELPDELLIEAKAMAARRRTTLRAILEHALRRELYSSGQVVQEDVAAGIETNADGLPVYQRRGKRMISSETVYQLMDDEGV